MLPDELEPFDLGVVVDEATVRLGGGRTVVFLDCGNADRSPLGDRLAEMSTVINIDHHHDNTAFGSLNLLDPAASSTAEVVWGLLHALEVRIDAKTAEALYIGLVTDTGRFSYENTTPRAHLMAAELLEAGSTSPRSAVVSTRTSGPPSSTFCATPSIRSSCTAVAR